MLVLTHRTIDTVQTPADHQCATCLRRFASANELRLHGHRCAVARLSVD
jgi:hypothetical protein